jgi:phospholipid/cholesterol/gamma-HCH transport system substrate-binding protein
LHLPKQAFLQVIVCLNDSKQPGSGKKMMKISNETKIGALTLIALTFLVLGYNFLQGRSVFKTGNFLYAKFKKTNLLMSSNPVFVNGFQVGNVYATKAADETLQEIIVEIKLNDDYQIPTNSVAIIEGSLLSTPSVNIIMGNGNTFLHSGDTLMTREAAGMFDGITDKLEPLSTQLEHTLASIDTIVMNANSILDPNTKGNLQSVIAHLNETTASMVVSAASLQALLNTQSGALAGSLNNVNTFTKTLSNNSSKIDSTLSNLQKTTEKLAQLNMEATMKSLDASVISLNSILSKIDEGNGSMGSLINDKTLYNNLTQTVKSLNTLMDDLRVHPKRYVNISVFGKKEKGDYLTEPLIQKDTTGAKP